MSEKSLINSDNYRNLVHCNLRNNMRFITSWSYCPPISTQTYMWSQEDQIKTEQFMLMTMPNVGICSYEVHVTLTIIV